MTGLPIEPIIFATYPRRIARLLGYIASILSGIAYIIYPPTTRFYDLDIFLPSKIGGLLFLAGGLIGLRAWSRKELLLDRICLSLIIIATFGLFLSLSYQAVSYPSWTRLGYVGTTLILLSFLTSRWQDVKHDERIADDAVRNAIND